MTRSDDGRDPECAVPRIQYGPRASASVCVQFNHSEVNDMISKWRMMAAIGLVLVAAGCFEHTYTVGAGAPAGPVVDGVPLTVEGGGSGESPC